MHKSKVLVVGGGPAGSAAAYFLAKKGIAVTILDKDKWPRDKICGGALTTNCLPILEKMDVLEVVDKKADFKFSGYVIVAPNGEQVKAPVRQRDPNGGSKKVPYCYVIRRDYFDQILLDKAKETGAKVLTETEAKEVLMSDQVCVRTKNGTFHEADVLIVADGSGGPITRQFQKNIHKGSAIAIRGYYSGVRNMTEILEFFLDNELGFGYGWLFPMGNGKASVGVGLDAAYLKRRKKNIRQVFDEMLEKPHVKAKMSDATLQGKLEAFPLRMGFDKSAFRHDRVLFVGDSAKLIYPLSGEGIAYALQSAEIAANVVAKVLSKATVDFNELGHYEIECQIAFNDFKYATRLQKLMSRPKVQKFFFKNSAYDRRLGQRAIGILEHSSDVKTFFNFRTIVKSFLIALKRNVDGSSSRGKKKIPLPVIAGDEVPKQSQDK